MRRNKYEMPFEVEHGKQTAEYVVEFTVDPAEKPTGPTYDCGGTPGCEASIADAEVFVETVRKCEDHRFTPTHKIDHCSSCRRVRERRPELDALIDEDELLAFAGEVSEPDWDAIRDAREDR